MEKDRETIFLRKRFGFVKMALQTGAHLMPAFAFGQSRMCVALLPWPAPCLLRLTRLNVAPRRSYEYARPGPPLLPASTPRVLSKLLGFAPLCFWGRWGSPVPFAVPVHVVLGRPIRVQQGACRGCGAGSAF